jgi:hypothetical protein
MILGFHTREAMTKQKMDAPQYFSLPSGGRCSGTAILRDLAEVLWANHGIRRGIGRGLHSDDCVFVYLFICRIHRINCLVIHRNWITIGPEQAQDSAQDRENLTPERQLNGTP